DSLLNGEALWLSLLLAVLLIPPVLYLWTGWTVRRSEIVGALSENGVRLYFTQFYPTVKLPATDLPGFFERHYDQRYGRHNFVAPLILFTIVSTLLLFLSLRSSVTWARNGVVPDTLPAVGVAAIAGAYLWIVTDIVNRCRSRELAPV